MPKTISFHNGAAWSRGHNTRDERYTKNQEHIDPALTENNITLRDMSAREAYEQIFGASVEEYNAKQKRSDRCIDSYYDKIKADKRKHPVYECIVQIGDRADTGNAAVLEREALERYAREWDERNPNLKLIGAYIHADEPDGTVHLHCDYIPVAECKRGMRLQNSLDKALTQQGFHTENIHKTAQIAWQDRERESLCAICRDLNIDAQRNQGIGQGREYLTPQEYRRAKEDLNEKLKPLKQELDGYKLLHTDTKGVEVERKKIPFSKRVSVPTEQLEHLEQQAKAYQANRDEIKNIRSDRHKLKLIAEDLQKRAAHVSEREQNVGRAEKVVAQMYDKQKHINERLESTEQELKAVKAENVQLRRQVQQLERELHPPKRSRGMER